MVKNWLDEMQKAADQAQENAEEKDANQSNMGPVEILSINSGENLPINSNLIGSEI